MPELAKRINITMPSDLHDKAVEYCKKHGTKFSTTVAIMWEKRLEGKS